MKTATLEDLRHNLDTIIEWVEQGEDVVVRRESSPPQPLLKSVDWNRRRAFRCRDGEPVLTRQDLDELFEEMRGSY